MYEKRPLGVKDEEFGSIMCIVDEVKGDGTVTLKGRLLGNE